MDFTEDMLRQFMGGGMQELTKATGAKSNQLESMLSMAIPALMQGMSRNASTDGGAASLARALDDHADDTDDVSELVRSADTSEGAKILQHVLGGQTCAVQTALAKKTGMSSNQVMQALAASAPALMSLLGTQKKRGGYDTNGLTGMFSSLMGGGSKGGLLETLISLATTDSDGNGQSDALDALGGLLGKR